MTTRELAWRAVYELLARRVQSRDWSFMNYGYAPAGSPGIPLDPGDEPSRLNIQLYRRVLGDTDLTGLDVLEIGSGRGGGASYLSRYHRPRSVTGVDFSRQAVRLSNRDRQGPGLRFVRGEAADLPFADATFDVVVNVESSHCYGSMPAFLAEVGRVLRPGGRLLWADFRAVDDLAVLQEQWSSAPLSVEYEEDITHNVMAALRLDDDHKRELIKIWIPRPLHRWGSRFAATEGSETFSRFDSGELRYLCARLVR